VRGCSLCRNCWSKPPCFCWEKGYSQGEEGTPLGAQRPLSFSRTEITVINPSCSLRRWSSWRCMYGRVHGREAYIQGGIQPDTYPGGIPGWVYPSSLGCWEGTMRLIVASIAWSGSTIRLIVASLACQEGVCASW